MKKTVLFLCILCVVLLPGLLKGDFYIKVNFGLKSKAKIQETFNVPEEYAQYIALGDGRKSGQGYQVLVEFQYQVNPYLTFSLGNGYCGYSFQGDNVDFSLANHLDAYSVIPEIRFDTVPVLVSVILSYPLSPKFQMFCLAGAGIYFGSLEGKAFRQYFPEGFRFEQTINYSGSSNSLGFHFGGGFDIELSEIFILCFEALYTLVDFNGISSLKSNEAGTFNLFLPALDSVIFPVLNYEISKISLSGLSLNIGIKFRF